MNWQQKIKLIKDDYWNLWYYWQGTIRILLYNKFPFLIRKHIKEQFEYRKIVAEKCSLNKSCLSCGCKTDDLFFANKACSLKKYNEETRINIIGHRHYCYDEMLNKKKWEQFKNI